jgi:sporulation protein YlmC with PRC-barrel domain
MPHIPSLTGAAAAVATALALALPVQAQQPAVPAQQAQQAAPSPRAVTSTTQVAQRALRVSRVLGSQVRNLQGQEIGNIEDMVVNTDTGAVRYAILRFDPGWFRFDRVYAVPIDRLRVRDGGNQVLLDVPRERLEMSGIERSGWSRDYFDDRRRIARLDSNWGLGSSAGAERLARASNLLGRPVHATATGEQVGQVEELVVDTVAHEAPYAVVNLDRGWFGADKKIAVRLAALHRTRDDNALLLEVDRARAAAMPVFQEWHYSQLQDRRFVSDPDRSFARSMGAGGGRQAR